MNGLGTQVTQIIRSDMILRGFDHDLRNEIQQGMSNHGINIINHTQVSAIEKEGETFQIKFRQDGQEEDTVIVDAVSLAALGRKPKTEKFGIGKYQNPIRPGGDRSR